MSNETDSHNAKNNGNNSIIEERVFRHGYLFFCRTTNNIMVNMHLPKHHMLQPANHIKPRCGFTSNFRKTIFCSFYDKG